MDGKLTDIATGKLLEKFGAGNHKPGSGSASAIQGMLSAQLLRTVIDLTNTPKNRTTYSEYLPELLRIKSEIETRIYSELETLFQEDSIEFDKVIKLRSKRDKEKDPLKRSELARESQRALKIATELPLKIAELSLELVGFADYVFDHGFKSARGDSAVALNSAISGVASCLSIVELNLISLPVDEWMSNIKEQKETIKERYQILSTKVIEKLSVLEKETQEKIDFHKSVAEFQQGDLADSLHSNSEIEGIVQRLQNTVWLQRQKIWKSNPPEYPVQILKPDVVLKKVMDYTFVEMETLGMYSLEEGLFEIAGIIDKDKKLVQVSKNFSEETKRFTAAHELGHAILHKQAVLHRDRALDGAIAINRNLQEMQADKFAAYFLMPTKMVVEVFQEVFEMERFIINENTVLAIRVGSVGALRMRCKNIRGLARVLASADYYGGKSFNSLSQIFGVSVETMAIRLEELQLLEF